MSPICLIKHLLNVFQPRRGSELKAIIVCSFCLALAGCVSVGTLKNKTLKKDMAEAETGVLSGVLTFLNKNEGASEAAYAEIWLWRDRVFRIDLTHPLGGAVGSFVSNKKRSQFLIYMSKTYVISSSKNMFVSSSARIPVSFQEMNDMFFMKKPSGWQCKSSESINCKKKIKKGVLFYAWSKDRRRMKIYGKSFEVLFQVEDFKTQIISPSVWKLKKPKNFSVERLK